MIEYRPFKLVYMSFKANSVRDYFHDREITELMKQGKQKEALERARSLVTGNERVGIEIIKKECVYE